MSTSSLAIPERLWSHEETASFLGIPETSLHQLNYRGTGPRSYKVGKRRRYKASDVLAWLETRASDRDPAA